MFLREKDFGRKHLNFLALSLLLSMTTIRHCENLQSVSVQIRGNPYFKFFCGLPRFCYAKSRNDRQGGVSCGHFCNGKTACVFAKACNDDKVPLWWAFDDETIELYSCFFTMTSRGRGFKIHKKASNFKTFYSPFGR